MPLDDFKSVKEVGLGLIKTTCINYSVCLETVKPTPLLTLVSKLTHVMFLQLFQSERLVQLNTTLPLIVQYYLNE